MKPNKQDGTRIDEITNGIYRISTPVSPAVIPGGFTFNQYLILDEAPLLYHTGPRKMFPLVREAISSVIPVRSLRYIGCSKIAKMVSVDDIALRPAHALADGEELSLGAHVVRWIDTPHLPHGWECGHLFENTTKTLFCGDLFTQGGHEHEPITTNDILDTSEEMRAALDYFSQTRRVHELMEKLAVNSPRVLACMHGAAWEGDGAALLRQLASALSR